MKYGITALTELDVPYTCRFSHLVDAKKRALELSAEYKVDFLVFEIIGVCSNRTVWEERIDIEGKDNGR